ncbi:MAG TPA: hypothetical protein VFK13_08165 [Gemmatimonadaceae bacterium]|nr:hypothetical protein [Gemmatimonadaceae bacterium]
MRSRYLLLPAALCAAGLLACADSVAPDVQAAADSAGVLATLVDSGATLPSNVTSGTSNAAILEHWVDVGFQDQKAYGQAFMKYLGTAAEQTLRLTLRTATSTVATKEATTGQYNVPFVTHTLWTTTSLSAPKTCGYIVEGAAVHKASDKIPPTPITKAWEWGNVAESSSKSVDQPACGDGCTVGSAGSTSSDGLFDLAYDPYATFDVSCGGTTPPGGTQYFPGDHTNGETVDFHTGVGDGGRSVCGLTAVVRWVCIDIYDERTGQWEEYACGYATTC